MSASSVSARMLNRRRFALMTLLSTGAPGSLWATTPDLPAMPELEGTTAKGQRLRLADLKGQVVLVFFWATDCAVCRDKMRELRANIKGWTGHPFTLLGVNMDPKRQDWLDYERLVAQSIPESQRFESVWAGGSGFSANLERPSQLPSALVIDKSGRLVENYRGRVPADAWNRIADLI